MFKLINPTPAVVNEFRDNSFHNAWLSTYVFPQRVCEHQDLVLINCYFIVRCKWPTFLFALYWYGKLDVKSPSFLRYMTNTLSLSSVDQSPWQLIFSSSISYFHTKYFFDELVCSLSFIVWLWHMRKLDSKMYYYFYYLVFILITFLLISNVN